MLGTLVHGCALIALGYALRAATFAAGWIRLVPCEATGALPALSIIVPARNEEANIEACVRSLAMQTLDVEIVVVDDRSADGTRAILDSLARDVPQLRVIDGEPLPDGWVGKPWALAQGARVARGEWLLFTDADSHHHPQSAASTLAFALEFDVAMLTIATRQELGSFAERAILPSILGMVLFATGPLDHINDPKRPNALANGQFILIERGAYEALGTHAALRAEIAEDVELARRIKRDGRFRMLLVDGEALVSVRMYRDFAGIWSGFVKNAYVGANGHAAALAGGFVFMSALSYVPPVLALAALARGRRLLALEAASCTAATMATSSWAIGLTGAPRRLGAYTPLGLGVFAAIVAASTFAVASGRGVQWRGRRYSGRERPTEGGSAKAKLA